MTNHNNMDPTTDRERALMRHAAARAVREVRGLDGAWDVPSDIAIAHRLYPDPEATVILGDTVYQYRRGEFFYKVGAYGLWSKYFMDPSHVAVLSSLLPRRELTEDLVARCMRCLPKDFTNGDMRRMLESIWTDIAAPTHPKTHGTP
jgi:hypothetical protein